MNIPSRTALRLACSLAGLLLASAATAQVTFYENDDYAGRTFVSNQSVPNFMDHGFNDRASSIVVTSQLWEVCENTLYGGQCVMLRPGNYPSLRAIGLNDRISSVRLVPGNNRNNDERVTPVPPPLGWQGQGAGRSFRANVTSVRGVFGAVDQRCWVEPTDVEQARGNLDLPGRRNGGGINTRDTDPNRGRDGNLVTTRDLQRCNGVPQLRGSDYWEVTYLFRGREYRIQTLELPGPTIVVDRTGAPRG